MNLEMRARVAAAILELAFNPGQRRGPDGRWIKMGGKGSAGKSGSTSRANKSPSGRIGRAVDVMAHLNEQGRDLGRPRPLNADDLPADVVKWAEQLFEFDDPATGFTARVSRVRGQAAPDPSLGRGASDLEAVVNILDASGKRVGVADRQLTFNRAGDKLQMIHLTFRLDPSAQGGGFSSRWLRRMEDRYREAGVDQVALTAADRVGGYAWAKAGFDFEDGAGAEDVATRMEKTLRALAGGGELPAGVAEQGAELVRRVRSGSPDERPTPMEFAMLGWTPGATTWPGKQAMLGASWRGVKEL